MGRTRTLPLALVLVLAFVLSAAPALIAAQEGTPEGEVDCAEGAPNLDQFSPDCEGQGVTHVPVQEAIAPGLTGKTVEQYVFTFEATAYLPKHPYPEAYIVKVVSADGAFFLEAGEEDLIIVDPQGKPINYYQQSRFVEDSPGSGAACTTLCVAPPNERIVIEQGMTVIVPNETTCLFCNITGANAELLVIASVPENQTFSWAQFTVDQSAGAARALPEAAIPGLYVGCG